VVKGINKRVIIVKAPEQGVFDEAIFIVREDASKGITPEELLREAQHTAGRYELRSRFPFLDKLKPPVFALLGGAAVGIAWLMTVLF